MSNSKGQEEAWYIDLKETGKVGKGEAPEGKKADGLSSLRARPSKLDSEKFADRVHLPPSFPVTLLLSDENFAKLIAGKTKAQQLFMSGKLKVKGNVMKGETLRTSLRGACLHGWLTRFKTQRRPWSPFSAKPAGLLRRSFR